MRWLKYYTAADCDTACFKLDAALFFSLSAVAAWEGNVPPFEHDIVPAQIDSVKNKQLLRCGEEGVSGTYWKLQARPYQQTLALWWPLKADHMFPTVNFVSATLGPHCQRLFSILILISPNNSSLLHCTVWLRQPWFLNPISVRFWFSHTFDIVVSQGGKHAIYFMSYNSK